MTTSADKTDDLLAYTQYDLKTYMQPVWQGNIMYNEIVMFFPNGKTKKVDPAPLLYRPKKVLSVRSYDLKTEYAEGIDYTVEHGRIALTENSRIQAWAYDDFYLSAPSASPAGGLPCIGVPGRYFAFGDGALFGRYQVCVTYTHEDPWDGPVPAYQGHKLPATSLALAQKQTIHFVYYGDSVTVGKEASGLLGIAPNMPAWADMVTQELELLTGAIIHATNTAKGGKTTRWGLANIEENVNRYYPDLVVLAFGMNDGSMSGATFAQKANRLISAIQEKFPQAEVLLVATMLPNPQAKNFYLNQESFADALIEKCEKQGVAVVNMTAMHDSLLDRKRYADMTGNNVNHPNDYLARVYVQTLFATLQDKAVMPDETPDETSEESVSEQSDATSVPNEQNQRPTASFFGLLLGGCTATVTTLPACALTVLGGAAILKKKKDE